jgi:aminoglycoside/choline kinase family phosphotransferase
MIALQMPRSDELQAEFIGHSGARVTLRQINGRSVVRKQAGTREQSARLQGQGRKQAEFRAAGIDTPQVLSSGVEGGLAFFDMDYVPGVSIAAQICDGLTAMSPALTAFVTSWIKARRAEVDGRIPCETVLDKAVRVMAACAANRNMGGHAAARLPSVGERLFAIDWPSLPRSPCHGDFTTENMLCDADGRLSLIDFDVPDISSYALDIAKLYQDLTGQWCLRRLAIDEPDGLCYRNAQVALRRVRSDVDTLLQSLWPDLLPELPALVCLNLMRAFPYSNDPAVCLFILDRVEALLPDCRATTPARTA